MDPREFLSQSRVVIVAGKGGVGKTTVSAALARMGAAAGLSVLIVAVEAKSGLVSALGATGFLDYGERELAPNIRARTLTPDIALVEYMDSHGLGKLSKKMANSGMVEVVATAAPGIKDILVLGKIKQLERSGAADLIIVDAPAAGHALTFLVSPRSVMDVARSGILRAQADEAFELLTDSSRCQVILVTLPEETPVNELVETEAAPAEQDPRQAGARGRERRLPEARRPRRRPREGRRRPGHHPVPGRGRGAADRRRVPSPAPGAPSGPAGTPGRRPEACPRCTCRRCSPSTSAWPRSTSWPAPSPISCRRCRRRAGWPLATRSGEGGAVGKRVGLDELVGRRSVVVCCGPGGVGKTTIAGVLALEGARQGRRAVVVTIDPARRLADALGLTALPDTPHRIEGPWPGELWALMLDARKTFDSLVARYARTPQQTDAILHNRFYRNIAGALSGTQEYMATEKLFELHADKRFDLVIVDTPPTRNALDFLDAPRRLTRFIDNRFYRLMMAPAHGGFRVMSLATGLVLKTVSRTVGSDVVSEAVTFFQAFEGMEGGFRERAQRVRDLLGEPGTSFVLVSSPHRDAAKEVGFFADKLDRRRSSGRGPRRQPDRTPASAAGLAESDRERARTLAGHAAGRALREPGRLLPDGRGRAGPHRRAGQEGGDVGGGGRAGAARRRPRPGRHRGSGGLRVRSRRRGGAGEPAGIGCGPSALRSRPGGRD